MPSLPPQKIARRNLAARGRALALEELLPLLRSKVRFPSWLLDLVREHGLDDLSIRDVWLSEDAPTRGGEPPKRRRGPRPLNASADTMRAPTANEMLAKIAGHEHGATTRDLARAYEVSTTTIAKRLRVLLSEGLVYKMGPRASPRYELSTPGRERLASSRGAKGRRGRRKR